MGYVPPRPGQFLILEPEMRIEVTSLQDDELRFIDGLGTRRAIDSFVQEHVRIMDLERERQETLRANHRGAQLIAALLLAICALIAALVMGAP